MVEKHGIFQGYYFFHYLGLDRNMRDQFAGHEYYDLCAEFCADFDQPAFDPDVSDDGARGVRSPSSGAVQVAEEFDLRARLGRSAVVKAAVFYKTGGPEVFQYEDVPDPAVRSGGLLVEVAAVGIQGGDLLHRQGGVLATEPHIVGYQASGVVREVGEGVTEFAVGQPVVATMGYGSHAELVSVPARAAWAVPEGLSLEEAAGVPIEFGTADDCLFEFGKLQSGETVLVQAGAGGVGLAAIQLAKAAGATVLATASSDDRLGRLYDYGMDHGINYANADVAAEVQRITGGKGVDLVVDSVGGKTLEGQHRRPGVPRPGQLGRAGGPGRQAAAGVAAHAEERVDDRCVPRCRDDDEQRAVSHDDREAARTCRLGAN